MAREWIKIKETGQLYIDKILVTFDVPLLFVCTDFENKKYLCLDVGENDDEYVIAETNSEYLVAMLTNQITMEYVFRKSLNGKMIIAKYDIKYYEAEASECFSNEFFGSSKPRLRGLEPKKFYIKKKEIISITEDSEKVSDKKLPQKDAYFELSNKEIVNYIELLKKQIIHYQKCESLMRNEDYIIV